MRFSINDNRNQRPIYHHQHPLSEDRYAGPLVGWQPLDEQSPRIASERTHIPLDLSEGHVAIDIAGAEARYRLPTDTIARDFTTP